MHPHVNDIIFSGDVIKIGRWRLPATHPSFRDSGPAKHYLFVFPRTSTWIQHAGGRAFVGDPNIGVLERLVRLAFDGRSERTAPQPDVVERARAAIARHFAARFTLSDLATATGTSVFHLCRVFRSGTGHTIHEYRSQLRLRSSLERVLDRSTDLSALALDLGYSTHSHFTSAFRAHYGTTPSAFRKEIGGRR